LPALIRSRNVRFARLAQALAFSRDTWPQLTVGGELGPARAAPDTYAGNGPTLAGNRIWASSVPCPGTSRQSAAGEPRLERPSSFVSSAIFCPLTPMFLFGVCFASRPRADADVNEQELLW